MNERASAAYTAYGNTTGWKNFRGDEMLKFDELPEIIQQAWYSAFCGSINYWLNNDFKNAVLDDDRVEQKAMHILQVGCDRGDEPVDIIRIALTSFIVDVCSDINRLE